MRALGSTADIVYHIDQNRYHMFDAFVRADILVKDRSYFSTAAALLRTRPTIWPFGCGSGCLVGGVGRHSLPPRLCVGGVVVGDASG